MATPPTLGSTNWGTPLDTYMASILTEATTALNNISTHEVAIDPHGDRAYALGLISPVLNGTNSANGYVKLNSSGLVPNNLLPSAGGLSDVYDVSSSVYGAVGNGITDDTIAIQAALTAAATAGGGEVWVPNGVWAVSSPLVVGNNTWVHLSPGATMIRKINSGSGLLPGVMLTNYNASTSLASVTGNILVSGGAWDATAGGTQTTACTMFQFANAAFCGVEQVEFVSLQNNTAIQLFGMESVVCRDLLFTGYTPTLAYASVTSYAVQLCEANSTEMAAGLNSSMYSNVCCSQISLDNCIVAEPLNGYAVSGSMNYGDYGYLVGSVTPASGNHSYINVGNCIGNGLPQAFWKPYSWEYVQLDGCFMSAGQFATVSHPSFPTTNMAEDPTTGVPLVTTGGNQVRLDVEQWSSLSYSNSFSGSAQYRLDVNNRVIIMQGTVNLPPGSDSYNSIAFTTLSWSPQAPRRWAAMPLAGTSYGNPNFAGAPRVEYLANGTVQLYGIPGNLNTFRVDVSGSGSLEVTT